MKIGEWREVTDVNAKVAEIVVAGIPVARDAMVDVLVDAATDEMGRLKAAWYLLAGAEAGLWPMPVEVLEWARFNNKEAKHD
jgi:hypothetical protein